MLELVLKEVGGELASQACRMALPQTPPALTLRCPAPNRVGHVVTQERGE